MGAFGSNGFGGFGGFGGLGPGGMMQNPFQHTPFGGASSYPQPTYNPSAAAASTTTTTNQSAYVPSGGSGGFEDVHPEAFSTEEDREGALRTLTGMGFEENIAEKALRATFYNVEAAVDYITSVCNRKRKFHSIFLVFTYRVKFTNQAHLLLQNQQHRINQLQFQQRNQNQLVQQVAVTEVRDISR